MQRDTFVAELVDERLLNHFYTVSCIKQCNANRVVIISHTRYKVTKHILEKKIEYIVFTLIYSYIIPTSELKTWQNLLKDLNVSKSVLVPWSKDTRLRFREEIISAYVHPTEQISSYGHFQQNSFFLWSWRCHWKQEWKSHRTEHWLRMMVWQVTAK